MLFSIPSVRNGSAKRPYTPTGLFTTRSTTRVVTCSVKSKLYKCMMFSWKNKKKDYVLPWALSDNSPNSRRDCAPSRSRRRGPSPPRRRGTTRGRCDDRAPPSSRGAIEAAPAHPFRSCSLVILGCRKQEDSGPGITTYSVRLKQKVLLLQTDSDS